MFCLRVYLSVCHAHFWCPGRPEEEEQMSVSCSMDVGEQTRTTFKSNKYSKPLRRPWSLSGSVS